MKKQVLTGQQIGLLGGPLYTTYKVLGAATLARRIKGRAVYWLETNDADFSEINHVDFIDRDNQLRRLTWDISSHGFSVGLIPIDKRLTALLVNFFDRLIQTEFTPQLRDLVLSCYRVGSTLAEASTALARELFGCFGIEVFDPADPSFRGFSRTILQAEADRTAEGNQCNLFCLRNNRREAVFKSADGYLLRGGEPVDLSRCELLPNVKTRNVCQDAFFKTHTYVAGPGEVAYIAQLDPFYQFHGVKKAAVQPRMSLVLLEPRVSRWLGKVGLTVDAVNHFERTQLVQQLIGGQEGLSSKEISQAVKSLTDTYLAGIQNLGLESKTLRKSLYPQIKEIIGRKRAREKENHAAGIRLLDQLINHLKPSGKPQERVFNLFYYMNLFGGLEFIDWLFDRYEFSNLIMETPNG